MATPFFAQGLEYLEKTAHTKRTVIMCAEAVPWRCHRSLVADALKQHGWQVFDIMSKSSAHEHEFTPFMRIKEGQIFYPKEDI